MRITSYNILDGGTGRLDELAAVLERQRPDIVGLVEAEDADLVQALARRLEMDFIVSAGRKHASALLSRFTIEQTINHAVISERFSRSALEAAVVVPAMGTVPIAVVHLHSRAFEADERVREKEVAALLDVMAGHRERGVSHLLCGDFNADPPTQKIDLEKAKKKTREAFEANGGFIPRRSIQRLLDAGYIDTLRAARGDAADVMTSFTTDRPGQRVDHIFAWGIQLQHVRDAWIDQGELTEKASDHFPVGAELNM